MRRFLVLAPLLSFFVSCASVQSVSLTQIPKNRSKPVSARAEKLIFFAFNFDNDFVDNITEDLRAGCKDGDVRGILTKDEVYSYVFAHKRVVTAQGYCVK